MFTFSIAYSLFSRAGAEEEYVIMWYLDQLSNVLHSISLGQAVSVMPFQNVTVGHDSLALPCDTPPHCCVFLDAIERWGSVPPGSLCLLD